MTSIFNTYYSHNLQRLNSSADEAKKVETPQAKEFAKVLSDLESKPEKAKASHPLPVRQAVHEKPAPAPAPSTRETLTNLDEAERDALTEPLPMLEGTAAKAQPSYDESLLRSVKFGPEPVKFLAPETVSSPLTTQPEMLGKAPAAPRILEASRTLGAAAARQGTTPVPTLPNERPPAPPKLAAAVREDTGPVEASHGHDAIKDIISTAGKFYGVDPNLSMAIAQVESSFQPTAVSRDGHNSKGIFQLLDSTGRDMLGHTGVDEHYDPFDPAQNAYLGVGYLRRLHDIFSVETNLGGNMRTVPATSAEHLEKLAVAAFNAGEGNVARAQARARATGKDPTDFASVEPFLPASTRVYVQKVSSLRQQFAARDIDSKITKG